ncbi:MULTISPECIES: hypothetical protein [unclassified Leptospira]|uniref:hypothetical protein n=1 Tax=unclassified Leptospira TaxID=2633828 RepID=UPI000347ED98|nr:MULTISPECIES: hypothetical protein [unclassified Leptospira]
MTYRHGQVNKIRSFSDFCLLTSIPSYVYLNPMYNDGLSLDEIIAFANDEFPLEFIHSLSAEIQEYTTWYSEQMKKRKESELIDNAIPMQYHSKIQNLLLKKAKSFGLKSSRNDDWGIYHYCVVETRNCRIIIRNSKSDFDTELVNRYSISNKATLYGDKYYFHGLIPLIISYEIDSSNRVRMGLYLRTRDDGMIAINPILKKAKDLGPEILPTENQADPGFEPQPSPKVQIRKKKA